MEINEIKCDDLSSEIHQLAVVLYPPELFNEKLLIRIRDCILKMPPEHRLKRWLKAVSKTEPLSGKDQDQRTFVGEVINSQFNLITDLKIKARIVDVIAEMPDKTLGERVLKSFMYLIIGNVTKSDNILKDIIHRPPYQNWIGYSAKHSLYHQLSVEHLDQILSKLSKHPADRSIYQLFVKYLLSYYQDEQLIRTVSANEGASLNDKLQLKIIERSAPKLVHFLRLKEEKESARVQMLRNFKVYPLEEQSYWIWPFIDIVPLVSEELVPELKRVEKDDPLWFIYLMDDEKLSDLYFKHMDKSFLPGRRKYLRSLLDDNDHFMLALFKLIEIGDINETVVSKTVDFLAHE